MKRYIEGKNREQMVLMPALGHLAVFGDVVGITIAQKRSTAKQPDMPERAIDSACIDFVLSPRDIAQEIVQIAGAEV